MCIRACCCAKPAGPCTLVAGVFEHMCVPQAAPLHMCAHTWSVFSPASACTHVCTSRYMEDGVTRSEDSVTCVVLHVCRRQPYMSDGYTHVACRRPHCMQNYYTCCVTGEPTQHYTCVTWKTVVRARLLHEEQCCVCR